MVRLVGSNASVLNSRSITIVIHYHDIVTHMTTSRSCSLASLGLFTSFAGRPGTIHNHQRHVRYTQPLQLYLTSAATSYSNPPNGSKKENVYTDTKKRT